ncbi:hypothetical protein VM1G_11674 [Cytospora mali]|uniref:Uncharacterized protein n=1 Tax=Cytospora mali TaxID=578113 RepID=A0A194W2S7_CYTMA|nr:hypothetical protein VM1G_11674 [Valsa mali]
MDSDLQVILYQSNHPDQPLQRTSSASGRIELQYLVGVLPYSGADTALQAASRLATTPSGEQSISKLLLASICTILYTSGSAAPEQLDQILQKVVRSTNIKYLDKIKRGARVANEIASTWAEKSAEDSDLLCRLDRATQAVLQGVFSYMQAFTSSCIC